jgi:putative sporulation protein YyaC
MPVIAHSYCETIDINGSLPLTRFSEVFTKCFKLCYKEPKNSIIILCIGTDRSTGDCLGPLVGHKLAISLKNKKTTVYGTLDKPVHAKNLKETLCMINRQHPNPFIIAIDASLGSIEKIGCISIGQGPLRPGAGVNKNLPRVGDMYISGVVNFGGFMEYLILQNTRLSLVMKMANIISSGIQYAFWKDITLSNIDTSAPAEERWQTPE